MNYERNRPPEITSFEDDLYGPTDAQAKVISEHITALEEYLGVELDEDDFDLVGRIAYEELGGDVGAAFGVVFDEVSDDEDEWETDFQTQLEAKQGELGRRLAPSEIDQLRDAHEDVSDPDLDAKFKEIWSDGKGQYDMDTAEGRKAYIDEQMTPEPEATVAPLSPDATRGERAEYMNKRLGGAEVSEDDAT